LSSVQGGGVFATRLKNISCRSAAKCQYELKTSVGLAGASLTRIFGHTPEDLDLREAA